MKQLFRIFALMAVFLMGSVATDAATLVYDFVTKHPTSTIRIDQGYKSLSGGYMYWSGSWAGLFGRKIAFGTDTYPSLAGSGGLVDYHPHSKFYVMNLSVGDRVTFNYSGTNPSLQYHTSGSAVLSGQSHLAELTSGQAYTISKAGNLCFLSEYTSGSRTTIINSIVVETASDTESVDVSNGMCTYCSKNPLDFSHSTQLKAYVATGYSGGKFTFKQVKYVPSNTGFLVVASSGVATGSIDIGRSEDYKDNAITSNLFTGCLVQTAIPTNMMTMYQYFVFGVSDGQVGIYRVSSNFQCAAGKAYLGAVETFHSYDEPQIAKDTEIEKTL